MPLCGNLKSVHLPNTVTDIGLGAFADCTRLMRVNIGNSVTSIGIEAFWGCTRLFSITIPQSVTSIGEDAFLHCRSLIEVINLSSLKISKGAETNGQIAYFAYVVHNGETKIIDKNGYLFYTRTGINNLLAYTGNDTDLVLPESYNGEKYEINDEAFYGCSDITSVTIPDSVTFIYSNAFEGCTSLTSVIISNSVTSILGHVFEGCTSLTNVYYKGTAEDWNAISIGSYNENLINAARYYYSEEAPTAEGNYWHYGENGEILIWE